MPNKEIKLTVTIQLPENIQSLNELEMAVNQEGQKIKQQIFQNELQTMTLQHKQSIKSELACPSCEKKTSSLPEPNRDN